MIEDIAILWTQNLFCNKKLKPWNWDMRLRDREERAEMVQIVQMVDLVNKN